MAMDRKCSLDVYEECKSCIPIFPRIGLGSCSLPPAKGQAQLHTEFTTGGLVLGSVAGFQDDIVGCSDASNERQ